MSLPSLPANVHATDGNGYTALHRAAEQGNQHQVMRLLRRGAYRGPRTWTGGQTALHLAAVAGHAHLLPLLINPSTLNQTDGEGSTALQLAVKHRQWDAAAVLVAAGACPGAPGFASSPLYLALAALPGAAAANTAVLLLEAMMGGPTCAALLAEAVSWANSEGQTTLLVAAHHGCQELAAKLVEAGADKDAADRHGVTPLVAAVTRGHVQLVPLLATPGNINLLARSGTSTYTALHYAAADGSRDMVEALLAAEAVLDTLDSQGRSPLGKAAHRRQLGVVTMLLSALAKQWCDQEQQARGVALVAAAVVPLAGNLTQASRCSWLLEVVLDVLGPEVAGEVCTQAQVQMQQQWEQHPSSQGGSAPQPGLSYLAEALLSGWLGTEERLHAARQPLVARLPRLVPGVGAEKQQQQQQREHQGYNKGNAAQKQQELVRDAELAAAVGQEQRALQLLEQFAALHLQHPNKDFDRGYKLLSYGLTRAARSRVGHLPASTNPADGTPSLQHFSSFRPPGVYTAFLAAWLGVRRRLQLLPQEMAATVVAAVKTAQQEQQQQLLPQEVATAVKAAQQQSAAGLHGGQLPGRLYRRRKAAAASMAPRVEAGLGQPQQQPLVSQQEQHQRSQWEQCYQQQQRHEHQVHPQYLLWRRQQPAQQAAGGWGCSSVFVAARRLVLVAAASALAGAAAPLVHRRWGRNNGKASSKRL